MATISSLGLGSGLDLNGLLDKLTKAEQQRLTPYTTKQSSYKAQLTGYGTLKGALEKFDNLSKEMAKRTSSRPPPPPNTTPSRSPPTPRRCRATMWWK